MCVGRVPSRWRGAYCLAPASLQRFGHSLSAPQLTPPRLLVPGPGAAPQHPRFQRVGGTGVRLSRSRAPLRPIGAPLRVEPSPAGRISGSWTPPEDRTSSGDRESEVWLWVRRGDPQMGREKRKGRWRSPALASFTLPLLRRIPRP